MKTMIRTESQEIPRVNSLYEVDIDRHKYIAEAYQIRAVPTLVAGTTILTGLPSTDELRSFLLQSVTIGQPEQENTRPRSVIRPISEISDDISQSEEIML